MSVPGRGLGAGLVVTRGLGAGPQSQPEQSARVCIVAPELSRPISMSVSLSKSVAMIAGQQTETVSLDAPETSVSISLVGPEQSVSFLLPLMDVDC